MQDQIKTPADVFHIVVAFAGTAVGATLIVGVLASAAALMVWLPRAAEFMLP